MKKRFFSLILVLAMLASLFVMPVSATETEQAAEAAPETTSLLDDCPCGCGEVLSNVEWLPYNVNTNGAVEAMSLS